MINHELKELFRQNSVHKKFVIDYDGGTITNSDLLMEEFSLEESLSSEEELRFGSCEASVVRFPVSNVFTSLNGKVLDISMVLNSQEDKPFKIGKYKVAEDVPTADRRRRDIVAYDAMYDVVNADVAEWYNALLPNDDSTVTFKQFRDSFFGYFGIEQVEVSLVNDAMIVTKTIQPTELSGSMVANAICELNGCFGHINRDGLMDYVFLKGFAESVYPSDELYPSDDLFPSESNYQKYHSSDYPSGGCDYQDYVVRKITGLEIRQEDNSVGVFVGEKENPYVMSDNFLIYGKSTEEMTTIAENMFDVIKDIEYRPFTLNTFRGNPCVEVGDGIKIYTGNQIIESYVLNRTLTGIQALSDAFETNGKEYRTTQVNSVQSQITQLKGKTNTLERTAEGTLSQIKDLENNVESEFRQTAEEISAKVSKGEIISEINQSAEQVKIQASKIALEGTVTANGNVTIGTDGKLTANNGSFEGTVDATDIQIKDKISMYSAGITLPKILRDIISYDEKYSDDYKPIVIGDGKSAVNIKNLSSDLRGKVECADLTMRIPIGASNSGNYDIAYINSKAPNASGAYLITVNGLWETGEFASHNIVSASSDIRLKDNIKPTKVENALDVINKFELYEFDWKESGAHQKIGFIADYLQEVDERLAVGGGYEEDGTPNYKTVDNFYMQGYIVKALQELSAENKELKSEIDKLKKSVSILLKKLGGMLDE